MHVALDVRTIQANFSGDRIYLENLIRQLSRLPQVSRLSLYGDPRLGREVPLELSANTRFTLLEASRGWLWTPVAVPRRLRHDNVEVFHASFLVPPIAPCPTVVTVHDATLRLFPHLNPPSRRTALRNQILTLAARSAKAVITDSEHSRNDLLRVLKLRPHKVHVVPLAAAEHFTPGDGEVARRRVAELLGVNRPYLLTVGWAGLNKNVPFLLETLSTLATPEARDLAIIIVGHAGGHTAEELQERYPALAGRLHFTGWVDNEDLVALYRGARVFAFPSLYEGFGLPVLEALACGTPVVSSNTSSLPEVAGEAALLIDPTDRAALGAALQQVLTDETLVAQLRELGLRQAARFSWERTAQLTAQVYEQVLGRG